MKISSYGMAVEMYSMGVAIAAFYKGLVENGIPQDVAIKMAIEVVEGAQRK